MGKTYCFIICLIFLITGLITGKINADNDDTPSVDVIMQPQRRWTVYPRAIKQYKHAFEQYISDLLKKESELFLKSDGTLSSKMEKSKLPDIDVSNPNNLRFAQVKQRQESGLNPTKNDPHLNKFRFTQVKEKQENGLSPADTMKMVLDQTQGIDKNAYAEMMTNLLKTGDSKVGSSEEMKKLGETVLSILQGNTESKEEENESKVYSKDIEDQNDDSDLSSFLNGTTFDNNDSSERGGVNTDQNDTNELSFKQVEKSGSSLQSDGPKVEDDIASLNPDNGGEDVPHPGSHRKGHKALHKRQNKTIDHSNSSTRNDWKPAHKDSGHEDDPTVPTNKIIPDESKQQNISSDEFNQNEINQDEINQDEINQDEINQDEINQDEINQDEISQEEINSNVMNEADGDGPAIENTGTGSTENPSKEQINEANSNAANGGEVNDADTANGEEDEPHLNPQNDKPKNDNPQNDNPQNDNPQNDNPQNDNPENEQEEKKQKPAKPKRLMKVTRHKNGPIKSPVT